MTTDAIIAIAVGTLVQAIIGYVWKRSVEDKDAKIERLSARVDDLDNEKVSGLQRVVQDEAQKGMDRRQQIYRRLDAHDVAIARAEERVRVLEETTPTVRIITEQLAAVVAKLEIVTDQVDRVSHQQQVTAQKLAAVEARQ